MHPHSHQAGLIVYARKWSLPFCVYSVVSAACDGVRYTVVRFRDSVPLLSGGRVQLVMPATRAEITPKREKNYPLSFLFASYRHTESYFK
jgi:hypothetical protein